MRYSRKQSSETDWVVLPQISSNKRTSWDHEVNWICPTWSYYDLQLVQISYQALGIWRKVQPHDWSLQGRLCKRSCWAYTGRPAIYRLYLLIRKVSTLGLPWVEGVCEIHEHHLDQRSLLKDQSLHWDCRQGRLRRDELWADPQPVYDEYE